VLHGADSGIHRFERGVGIATLDMIRGSFFLSWVNKFKRNLRHGVEAIIRPSLRIYLSRLSLD